MHGQSCLRYGDVTIFLSLECCKNASWIWGEQFHSSLRRGTFFHPITSFLRQGRSSIEEFLRVTIDDSSDVSPSFAEDLILLSRELYSDSILDRSQRSLEQFHLSHNSFPSLSHFRSAQTDALVRSQSVSLFLANDQLTSLPLPLLHRWIPSPESSSDRQALFSFFLDCLDDRRYGASASVLFTHLDAATFTFEELTVLDAAGFRWGVFADSLGPLLIEARRENADHRKKWEELRNENERIADDAKQRSAECRERKMLLNERVAELEKVLCEIREEVEGLRMVIAEQSEAIEEDAVVIAEMANEIEGLKSHKM
jgi:hypothetical protein